MYCKKCGNRLEENEKFCPYCGENQDKEDKEERPKSTSSTSTISLILGILACVFFWNGILSIPLAITSIVLGVSEKKKENKFQVGILLGIISLILTVLMILLIIFGTIFLINHVDEWDEEPIINDIWDDDFETSEIRGYSWQGSDNSVLYLNKDNTYIWYEKDENRNDNYYQGMASIYTGESAIQYIVKNLKEFGITEEEQRALFDSGKYKLNNYYLIILNCEKNKIGGEEKTEVNTITYYYGFYKTNLEQLELVNMSTENKSIFMKKERITHVDV